MLFGKPNIEKLEARRNIKGLSKVLLCQRNCWFSMRAAEALGRLRDTQAIAPLISATLTYPFDDVRRSAADALVCIGIPVVEPLIAALNNRASSGCQHAIQALGQIGDPRAVTTLILALRSGDKEVQKCAATALSQIGVPAMEHLFAALREEWSRFSSAIEFLTQFGDAVVEPLVAALDYQDADVREAAAQALGQIGEQRAVEPLVKALSDKNQSVQKSVIEALYKLKWKPTKDAAGAAYWATRGESNKCVKIGAPAVEALITALQSRECAVGASAAKALGHIGDPRAVEPLIAAIGSFDDVRREAINALKRIRDPRAVAPLVRILINPREHQRDLAADALCEIGEPAVEPLIAVLNHPWYDFEHAIQVLGQIGDPRAVQPLVKMYFLTEQFVEQDRPDAHYDPRPGEKAARNAILKLGKAAVEPLISLLGSVKDKFILSEVAGTLYALHQEANLDDETRRRILSQRDKLCLLHPDSTAYGILLRIPDAAKPKER